MSVVGSEVQSIPPSYTTITQPISYVPYMPPTQPMYETLAYMHQNAPLTPYAYSYNPSSHNLQQHAYTQSYNPLGYMNENIPEIQDPVEKSKDDVKEEAQQEQAQVTVIPHTIYYVNNIPHVCYAHQPDILYPMTFFMEQQK